MKVYTDIDGSVKIEISRDEVKNHGVTGTFTKCITVKIDDALLEVSNEKALAYMQAIGNLGDKPINDVLSPSSVITLGDENTFIDEDENPFPRRHELGDWVCTDCGAHNIVSVDDGCTNCG